MIKFTQRSFMLVLKFYMFLKLYFQWIIFWNEKLFILCINIANELIKLILKTFIFYYILLSSKVKFA